MGHVMGIAIVDGQIASVVRDDNDEVIATNTVDLAEESASAVGATNAHPIAAPAARMVGAVAEESSNALAASAPPSAPDPFGDVKSIGGAGGPPAAVSDGGTVPAAHSDGLGPRSNSMTAPPARRLRSMVMRFHGLPSTRTPCT